MWTEEEINAGRAADRMAKDKYFGDRAAFPPEDEPKRSFWRRLKWW
jgi:hypothetical protein